MQGIGGEGAEDDVYMCVYIHTYIHIYKVLFSVLFLSCLDNILVVRVINQAMTVRQLSFSELASFHLQTMCYGRIHQHGWIPSIIVPSNYQNIMNRNIASG